MKKNYFLHTAILLVALVCGSVPVWSQTYKKISSIEELTDGKYVIAYENMAMENKANGSRIAATAINVTDNAIISPDASIIWEITTTANGMSINNNGTYVVGVNSNNASLSSNFEEKTCEWNFFCGKKTIFEPPTYNIVIDFCNITAAVSGLHVTSQIATKKI